MSMMSSSSAIRSAPDEDEDAPAHHQSKRRRLNPAVEVGLMRDGSARGSASFVGSASGIHFINSVYSALKGRSNSSSLSHLTLESNTVPGEDDKLSSNPESGSSKSLWQTSEVDVQANSQKASFTFEDILDWTSSYFDVWHPAFPFLHAPSILEKLETLSQHGTNSLSPLDLATIKAIFSISLADRKQMSNAGKKVPSVLVFDSFGEALDSIQTIMTRPGSIQALQAAVCVQLFLVSMLRLNAASRLGGVVIRVSFQLGLHRCPAQFASFSAEEQQIRKRLFWSIYCVERYICQALGLPLTLHDDDIDVCLPDHECHIPQRGKDTGSTSGNPLADPSPKQDDRLRLLSLMAKHAEIRGLIMELRNKSVERRAKSWEVVVSIDTKLSQWWNQAEDSVEQASLNGTPLSKLHQTVLQVLKYESLISLNRPLLASSKGNPDYAAALQSCISASKSIIKALFAITPSQTIVGSTNSADGLKQPMFWPSFTWAVWMSAFIILYAGLEREISQQIAVHHTELALQILAVLATRGNVWPSACALVIRDIRLTLLEHRTEGGNGQSTSDHDTRPNNQGPQFGSNGTTLQPQDSVHVPASPVSSTTALPQHVTALNAQDLRGTIEPLRLRAPDLASQTGLQPATAMTDPWLDLTMPLDTNLPTFPSDGLDPLGSFDIPFWINQDNYTDWMEP